MVFIGKSDIARRFLMSASAPEETGFVAFSQRALIYLGRLFVENERT
jgi:hypothetical protein